MEANKKGFFRSTAEVKKFTDQSSSASNIRFTPLLLPQKIPEISLQKPEGQTVNVSLMPKPNSQQQEIVDLKPVKIDIDKINEQFCKFNKEIFSSKPKGQPQEIVQLKPVKIDIGKINEQFCKRDKSILNTKPNRQPQEIGHLKPVKIDIDKINEQFCKHNKAVTTVNQAQKGANKQFLQNDRLSVSKQQKINKGIRKELFKNRQSIYRSYRRTSNTITNKKSIISKKLTKLDESPLVDVTLMENHIFNTHKQHLFKFKSPKKLGKNYSFAEFDKMTAHSIKQVSKKQSTAVNNTSRTELEFLQFEKQCKISNSDMITQNSNTVISEYMKNINTLLDRNEEAYDQFKKSHDERVKQIKTLLQKIETTVSADRNTNANLAARNDEICTGDAKLIVNNDEDKENVTPSKRCERIAPDNLRVFTLKKSANKSVRFNIESPSTNRTSEKALALYNSFRNEYNVLLSTPKANKFLAASHSPKSTRKIISQKLHQQCLMLEDS